MPSAIVGAMGVGTSVLGRRRGTPPRRARTRAACTPNSRGPGADLAVAQQLGEAAVGAEHVAAVADRHHDVVGRGEPELLPQLVGQRLGALDEERLPVVAGVEDLGALGQRRLRHVLARALDRHHLGAAGGDLGDLRVRRRLRHQDAAGHPGRRRIRRERGAGVAGGVLEHALEAAAAQVAHHHGHAAVLERAGRHHELELVGDGRAAPLARHERRPSLAQADRVPDVDEQGRRVAPHRAPRRCRCRPAAAPAPASGSGSGRRRRTSAPRSADRSGR